MSPAKCFNPQIYKYPKNVEPKTFNPKKNDLKKSDTQPQK